MKYIGTSRIFNLGEGKKINQAAKEVRTQISK